jgi:adenine-specific DNA-methyltransferase
MPTTNEYTKLKLSDLLQLCKERGLKGFTGLKKADLIELLSNTSSTALIESEFVLQSMITYIGNKRKLIPWIMEVVEEIRAEFGGRKLFTLDGFAGSGVVSRALMPFCSELYTNDCEYYSYILLRCFLETPSDEQKARIFKHYDIMDCLCKNPKHIGFVSKLYSPQNTSCPQSGERCFYTRENAMIIDTLLNYIFSTDEDIRHYLLGPLIVKASINVNTAGVFRGFYKKDGIGHFGGAGENALERILAPIELSKPLWSSFNCKVHSYNLDIIELLNSFNTKLDLIYLDPPYNEHPYGSNYFMLNLIAKGKEPVEYSKVSGIPKDWNKSTFNGRGSAFDSMFTLLEKCISVAKYTLISYNNEGLVTEDDWKTIFTKLDCHVKKYEKEYDTYHGSRNLSERNKKVVEIMYLVSK